MYVRLLIAIVVLGGCRDPEPVDSAPDAPLIPSAWEVDVPAEDTEPLTVAQIEAALPGLLALMLELDAVDVMALYDERVAMGEPGCPYREVVESEDEEGTISEYWYGDGCVTSQGVTFDGYTYYREYDARRQADGLTYAGSDIKGNAVVVDDAGTFVAGGVAYLIRGADNAGRNFSTLSGVQGTILWTGSSYPDAWFTQGVAAELEMQSWWRGAPMITILGPVSGLEGDIPAFSAVELTAMAEGDCPQELGGALWLRDRAGRWSIVEFQGAISPDDAVDDAVCDGCGVLYQDNQSVGAVCVDPAPLLDWTASPW
ncbi:MAG: hypothetical protein H6739_34765 [Alphaproteobacteria bacterium]|nr:hypothetical protein [Alphaproteobacteria bacterium]